MGEEGGRAVKEKVKGKKGKAAEKEEETGPEVGILRAVEAPRSVLNRPMVLRQEGKIKQEEPEKSHLQR